MPCITCSRCNRSFFFPGSELALGSARSTRQKCCYSFMAPPQLGTDDLAAAAALFLLLMASYCFVFIRCLRRRPSSRRRDARVLPPSPPGLPIIGNMHQRGRGNHHLKLHALAQRHGDVFLLRLGTVPALVVSSAAAAEEVLRRQDHVFCGRPQQRTARGILYGCRDVAFSPYGERWRQLRRVAAVHLLSARRVDSLRALRAEEVAALVGRIRRAAAAEAASNAAGAAVEGIEINVSELVVGLTNAVISRAVFGDKLGDMDIPSLRALMKEVLDLLETIAVSDMFPRLRWVDWVMGLDKMMKRTAAKLDEVLEGAIQAHEKSSGNSNGDGEAAAGDLLDDLLSVVKEGGEGFMLDRVDVKALVLDFFLAGTDTTSKAIERAMALLIKNPREMTKVQEEVRQVVAAQGGVLEEQHLGRMSRLQATLKEAMRLHPPVPLLVPRETIRDTKLHGYDIPAKTRVIVNAWAIGRDSRSWENAGEFLPERFMHVDGDDASGGDCNCKGSGLRFIPFGAGRRGCPGNAFATRLAELALANLLFHFDWELPEGQDVESFEVAESSSGVSPALILVVKPPTGMNCRVQ